MSLFAPIAIVCRFVNCRNDVTDAPIREKKCAMMSSNATTSRITRVLVSGCVFVMAALGASAWASPLIPPGGSPKPSTVTISPSSQVGGFTSTGTVNLTSAPSSALSVSLSSSNAAVASVPATVTVAAGAMSANFTITTTAVTANTAANITATANSGNAVGVITVTPPVLVSSLTLLPAGVTGGSSSTGTVTLSSTAPAAITVTLSTTNSAATVPAGVTVAAGQSQATFTISSGGVAAVTVGNIVASYNGSSKTQTFTVYPPQLGASPTGFTISPSTIAGGGTVTGTITLTGAAPSGGYPITLTSSNSSAVNFSASVSVPAGSTTTTVPIKTSSVNFTTTVTVTASDGNVTVPVTITLVASHLWVSQIVMPSTLVLNWDLAATGAEYMLYRDGNQIATPASAIRTYNDLILPLTNGHVYVYQLYDTIQTTVNGVVTNTQGALLATEKVAPYQVFATDNQAVDSRLDPRYSTNVFVDHCFGSTMYKGGLFVGYASDPARVGRSFAHFSLPPIPPGSGETFRNGTLNAYFTGASGTSVTNMTVGVQSLVNAVWTASTLVWSHAPALDPTQAAASASITYDPNNPVTQWIGWPLTQQIYSALIAQTPMSIAWASSSESSPGWAYFAKNEFGPQLGPCIAYLLELPVSIEVDFGPSMPPDGGGYTVHGNFSGPCTVVVNGIGPTDLATVTISSSGTGVSLSASSTAGDPNNSFNYTNVSSFSPFSFVVSGLHNSFNLAASAPQPGGSPPPTSWSGSVTISASINGVTASRTLTMQYP